jgi:hypothetical protein
MAKLMQMHNGREKMVRNRFGGDNKRGRDYDSTVRHRRERVLHLSIVEQLAETRDMLADRATTKVTATANRFCHIAQTDAPTDGVIRIDDAALTLRYEGGKLASAHCRG